MKQNAYVSVTTFSFGEVRTEIKPDSGFQDQRQALDAMLLTAHSSLTAWVIDNTIDPEAKNGRQEEIKVAIKDGNRQIAEIVVSVPTTTSYTKAMFDRLLQQTIVPEAQKAARSYTTTISSGQKAGSQPKPHQLTEQILPSALQEASRVTPRQLVSS